MSCSGWVQAQATIIRRNLHRSRTPSGAFSNRRMKEVHMRKILTAGLAALTLAGATAAVTTPAQAQPHGGWRGGGGWHGGGGWRGGYHRGGGGWGYVGAGLAGLAVGAALAGPHYYGYPHYGYGYYGPYDGYYADDCVAYRRVWDPYYGGYVSRRVYVPC